MELSFGLESEFLQEQFLPSGFNCEASIKAEIKIPVCVHFPLPPTVVVPDSSCFPTCDETAAESIWDRRTDGGTEDAGTNRLPTFPALSIMFGHGRKVISSAVTRADNSSASISRVITSISLWKNFSATTGKFISVLKFVLCIDFREFFCPEGVKVNPEISDTKSFTSHSVFRLPELLNPFWSVLSSHTGPSHNIMGWRITVPPPKLDALWL